MQVLEIFESIDGEVNFWGQGTISTFVRLAGCNLRCSYCDTKKSWNEKAGKKMKVEEIFENIKTEKITLTGGEPLMHPNILDLEKFLQLSKIMDKRVSIETNGTLPIPMMCFNSDYNTSIIMDFKMSYLNKIRFSNIASLRSRDFIKFIIEDGDDFSMAVPIIRSIQAVKSCRIALSAVGFTQGVLLEWILKVRLTNVVFNVQLHKLLDLK